MGGTGQQDHLDGGTNTIRSAVRSQERRNALSFLPAKCCRDGDDQFRMCSWHGWFSLWCEWNGILLTPDNPSGQNTVIPAVPVSRGRTGRADPRLRPQPVPVAAGIWSRERGSHTWTVRRGWCSSASSCCSLRACCQVCCPCM